MSFALSGSEGGTQAERKRFRCQREDTSRQKLRYCLFVVRLSGFVGVRTDGGGSLLEKIWTEGLDLFFFFFVGPPPNPQPPQSRCEGHMSGGGATFDARYLAGVEMKWFTFLLATGRLR